MTTSGPRRLGAIARHLALVPVFLALIGLSQGAQDLSTFLSQPPAPGAWAAYRIDTTSSGRLKRERFNLAITGKDDVNGEEYVWLEAGPTNFASYRDGYLRLLIKGHPSPAEALNPFLEALALAYQEPAGEPFKLTSGAISFMHGQAKNVKVHQDRKDLPPAQATSVLGKSYPCTCEEITTTTESSFLGRHFSSTEKGVYWFSPETPFTLVRAEIERQEISGGKERDKSIVVQLRDASRDGSQSHFTKPPSKEKGLLGILFH